MEVLEQLAEALRYGFIQRALIAGSFVAISCAFLGVFLVLRRFAMIGDGLSHFAFGAIGLGLFLQLAPLWVAVPLTVVASLVILRLSERAKVHGDAAIGMIAAIGVSLGVILASLGGGFNVDLFSYLFGDILAISPIEAGMAMGLSALVMTVTVLFYHDLFVITFDEEHARSLGVKARWINKLLIVLTAVTVVLGIKVVGTLLVSSMIIFPAVTALRVARGFKGAIAMALVVSVVSVVGGILVAFVLNLPAGASIVMLNAVFFVTANIAKRWIP